LTWNDVGAQSSVTLLIFVPATGVSTYSTGTTNAGTSATSTAATSEVENFYLSTSDFQGESVGLTYNGTTYTTSTMGNSASMADLITALNSAGASGGSFTLSEITGNSPGIQLTWNTAGSVSSPATLSISSSSSSQTYAASETTTGAAASRISSVNEVQNIALTDSDIQSKNVTLNFRSYSLIASGMSSKATLDDLVAALTADSDYANMPFTLSVDSSSGSATGLLLTWNSGGSVFSNASLSIVDPSLASTMTSTETQKGAAPSLIDGTNEVQRISINSSLVSGHNIQLKVGDLSLYSGVMGANSSFTDLLNQIKANPLYSSAPFLLTQDSPGYLTLTWKTAGPVSDLAKVEIHSSDSILSLLKRGSVNSRDSALGMVSAVDFALGTIQDFISQLAIASIKINAAVDRLTQSQQFGLGTLSGASSGFASAIGSMLRMQFSNNPQQAVQAQANFTPQAVVNTLA
jgi:hypothetical protein